MPQRIKPAKSPSRPKPNQKPNPKPAPQPSKAKQSTTRAPRAKNSPLAAPPSLAPSDVRTLRELFWQNVLREMLSGLIVASMKLHAHAQHAATKNAAGSPPAQALAAPTHEERSLLDGRVGLVTRRGERIPIASIMPVFAATAGKTPHQRAMSAAVEGTVFQVLTPAGEVYTLPLHEVRGFHALSEELMAQLSEDAGGTHDHSAPFGFAAFTSLARGANGSTSADPTGDAPGAATQGAD